MGFLDINYYILSFVHNDGETYYYTIDGTHTKSRLDPKLLMFTDLKEAEKYTEAISKAYHSTRKYIVETL